MSKNKISLFLIFALIAGLALTVFNASSKGEAQAQQDGEKKEKKVRVPQMEKNKLFDATPIVEGVMTAKQKKHSKIFKGYKNRPKLRDLINQRGDVDVIQPVGNVRVPESFDLNTYLQGLSCKADAVVVGTVKSKASQINDDGTFIFTDYEFTAEDVLKSSATAPITSNTNITITRTGGAVKLNGHKARAIDYREVPLIEGEHYLLFLKFVPETGAYKSLDSSRDDDSFQILGNRVIKQVSRNPLPFDGSSTADANGFMAQVRAALNSGCINQGGAE